MGNHIKVCIKIFTILCLTTAAANKNIYDGTQDTTLTDCVVKIAQQWSSNSSFLDVSLMNVIDGLEISILHKVKGLRFITRTFSWSTQRIYSFAYVIQTTSYQELKHGLSEATTDHLWNPKATFIIILQNFSVYDISDIENLLIYHNMYDITLMLYQNEDYSIYKFNASSKSYCGRAQNLVLALRCSEYVNQLSLPALSRSQSIRNCRFKFITHEIWPFINFDNTDNVKGIEQRIIREFEQHEGVKIILQLMIENTDKYGDIIPKYVTSMLKKVENNEYEGTVGGHTNLILMSTQNLSPAYPVIIGTSVIVLAHADELGPWEGVFKRSSNFFIVAGIVIIILCVAVSSFSIFPTHTRSFSRDALLVLGYILNKAAINNTHPRLPQRLVFTSLLCLALSLPYIIQSYLYGSLTCPMRGYEPKQYEELSRHKLVLYTELFANRKPPNGIMACGSRLNCILEVKNSKTKSLYTVISSSSFLAFTSKLTDDQCNLKVYTLDKPFNIELRMILLRRGSVLLDPFNKVLVRLGAGGLIHKYFKDIEHFEAIQCKLRYSNYFTPLKTGAFFGSIIVLVVGYMISLIVFVLEIILYTRESS